MLVTYLTRLLMQVKAYLYHRNCWQTRRSEITRDIFQKSESLAHNVISRLCVTLVSNIMWVQTSIIVDSQAERQKARHCTESYRWKSDRQLRQETTDGCFVVAGSLNEVHRSWRHLCFATAMAMKWRLAYPRENIPNGTVQCYAKHCKENRDPMR
jgi:hypothetical protein